MKISALAACVISLSVSAGVAFAAGPLARVYIAPQDVGLAVGVKQNFKVIGEDVDGNEVTVPSPATWSADPKAGSVLSGGAFTASITPGKYRRAVSVSVPGGFTAAADVEVYSNENRDGFVIERSIGSMNAGEFRSPADVCLDGSGNMYVLCRDAGVVNRFDSQGRFVFGFTLKDGVGAGIAKLAVDPGRSVYVLNGSLSKVQKYGADGAFVTEWGSVDTGDGQFRDPKDIATDANGNVYVSDYFNGRVQVFLPNGTFLRSIPVTHDYLFGVKCNPIDIAVDGFGNVYASVYSFYYSVNLIKFNPAGVAVYCGWFQCEERPRDIAVDSNGCLYGTAEGGVIKFGQVGDALAGFGSFGFGPGQFTSPSGIAVGSMGRVYVAEEKACRVQVLNPDGTPYASYASTGTKKGQLRNPCGVAVDTTGNVYVADTGNCRVQVFDTRGGFVREIASKEALDSAFACPAGVSVDKQNRLFLTNALTNRVQVYSSAGALLYNWVLPAPADATGVNASPMGIACDSQGYLWAVDSYFNTFGKFNVAGTALQTARAQGVDVKLAGVAIDPYGAVYVTDSGNCKVQKFTSSGTFVSQFGSPGTGNGQLKGPAGLTFDSGGNIYVADSDNCRVEQFTHDGNYGSQIGSRGYGKFEMWNPVGVHVDPQGALWVADTYNHRVLKYWMRKPGDAAITIASPTAGDVYTSSSATINISGTSSGSVTSVTWSNDRGGSGTCTGTASWSASGIVLSPGPNVIAVAARDITDLSGYVATDSIVVMMEDSTPPSVSISSPTTEPDWAANSQVLNISGTASDDGGIASVTWSNSTGASGVCSGTTAWTGAVALTPGFNNITVVAQDTAGLTKSDSLSVFYTPGSPVSIAQSKRLTNGTRVYLSSVLVSAVFGQSCYLQDPLRSSGIRFELPAALAWLVNGKTVDVAGTIQTTPAGERYISGRMNMK